jgi:hypothetical protein
MERIMIRRNQGVQQERAIHSSSAPLSCLRRPSFYRVEDTLIRREWGVQQEGAIHSVSTPLSVVTAVSIGDILDAHEVVLPYNGHSVIPIIVKRDLHNISSPGRRQQTRAT